MSNKVGLLAIASAALIPAFCQAQDDFMSENLDADRSETVRTVYDMLRIDAIRAGIAEREALREKMGARPVSNSPNAMRNNANSDAGSKPEPDKPKTDAPAQAPAAQQPAVFDVQAIYGLGEHLYADVSVNGAVVRFMKGQALPLGYAEFRFHLAAINTPCVKLTEQQTVYTTCLVKSGL